MKLRNRSFILLLVIIASAFLTSCKEKRPEGVLSKDDMEDVLYDYHIAQSIASSEGKYDETNEYVQAVFKKYGITAADFDSSMVWYTRHTSELNSIYSNLAERMKNESGVSGEDSQMMGDTTNLWTGRHFHLLSAQASSKVFSFHIKGDTSFHQHDRITLSFYSRFLSNEMPHNVQCAVVVKYKNDCSQSAFQQISMSCLNNVSVSIDSALVVKSITGFVYLNGELSRQNMLMIDGLHVIRMRNSSSVVGTMDNAFATPATQTFEQESPQFGVPQPIQSAPESSFHPVENTLKSEVPVDTSSYSKDRPEYGEQVYSSGRLSPREERNMKYGRRVVQSRDSVNKVKN